MAISKVIYGEDTLIDLTSDTVSSETLAVGATAHNSAGEPVVGAVTLLTVEEIAQQAAQKVDKESLGLNNVDNTSDMDKPVSTAIRAVLGGKQNIATYHYDGSCTDAEVAAWLDTILAGMPEKSSVTVTGDFFNGSHVAYGTLYKYDMNWASVYTTSYTEDEWRMLKRNGEWLPSESITRATKADVDSLSTVFWAVYGETTVQEIYNATQAGKLVMCKYNNRVCTLMYANSDSAVFGCMNEYGAPSDWIDVIDPNLWSEQCGGDYADYTIDYGTSGGWTYRKWASGIAECWISNFNFDNFGVSAGGSNRTSLGFPFSFVDTNLMQTIAIQHLDATAKLFATFNGKYVNYCDMYVHNFGATDVSGFTVDIHITGRWK